MPTMPTITTLQIAGVKERFLEKAVRLVVPPARNGNKLLPLPEDVEDLTQDAIGLFSTLLRCDEQHNLLAGGADYDYLTVETELTTLFSKFLVLCNELLDLGKTLGKQGRKIKNQSELEQIRAHVRRLVNNDQSFYRTKAYLTIAERAYTEYQSGQVEEWPT